MSGDMPLSHPRLLSHYFYGDRLHEMVNHTAPFRVLVAGGGTGDGSLYFAQAFGLEGLSLELVHLDLSPASNSITRQRFEARGLEVPKILTGSILDIAKLDIGRFDLINCMGVIHHLADPAAGMRALKSALKDNGVIAVMLYGETGRTGIYDIQRMMQMLLASRGKHSFDGSNLNESGAGSEGSSNDGLKEDLRLLKSLYRQLPETHRMKANSIHGGQELDIEDAEWVDRFLHPCDIAFSVPTVYDLLDASGLKLGRWMPAAQYDPLTYLDEPSELSAVGKAGSTGDNELIREGAALSEELVKQRATFAELLSGNIAVHYFFAVKEPAPQATPQATVAQPTKKLQPGDIICRTHHLPQRFSAGGLEMGTNPIEFEIGLWHLTVVFSAIGYEALRLADCNASAEQLHGRLTTLHPRLASPALMWQGFQEQVDEMMEATIALGLGHISRRRVL
jgi:SAM-dependent methyltransferase